MLPCEPFSRSTEIQNYKNRDDVNIAHLLCFIELKGKKMTFVEPVVVFATYARIVVERGVVSFNKRRWCVITQGDPNTLILYDKGPEVGSITELPLHTLDATGCRIVQAGDSDVKLRITFPETENGLVLCVTCATVAERHLWEAALTRVIPQTCDLSETAGVRRLSVPRPHRAIESLAALDIKRKECQYNTELHKQQQEAQAHMFTKREGDNTSPLQRMSPSVMRSKNVTAGQLDWAGEYERMMEQRERVHAVCMTENV